MINAVDASRAEHGPSGVFFRDPCFEADHLRSGDHEREAESAQRQAGPRVQPECGEQGDTSFLGGGLEILDEACEHGGEAVTEVSVESSARIVFEHFAPLG